MVKSELKIDHFLDITKCVCPMTFVKVKLMMECMRSGELVRVRLNSGEPLINVPLSVRQEGHEIVSIKPSTKTSVHLLLIRKK